MGENNNDLTYCELRAKEIINTCDGRRLGRIVDIVFTCNGSNVKGIVVPYTRKVFFSRSQEIFIPWKCINKIGTDVILVNLVDSSSRNERGGHRHNPCRDDCDTHYDDCESNRHDDCRPHDEYRVRDDCPPNKKEKCDGPKCDKKCEKCMLFDCAYRWKD